MVLGLSVLLLVNLVVVVMLLLVVVEMLCFLSSRALKSQRLTLSVLVRNVIDLAVRESVVVGRVHVERRL